MKKSKKTKQYMSEESFKLLMESLNQALQHARGERNDLRVTVLPVPLPAAEAPVAAERSNKEAITQELAGLSEASLRQVADYVAFLKFREARNHGPHYNLDDLLAGINEQNLHPEIETGPAVGKEAW